MNSSNTSNSERLRAIILFFGLSVSQVARTCKMSVPYLSRILSQNGNHIAGSSSFWLAMEKALGQLVQERKNQVFDIPATDAEKVEQLLKVG